MKRTSVTLISLLILVVTLSGVMSGCGQTQTISRASKKKSTTADPLDPDLAATQAKVIFHHSNFYTLTNPNSQSCAGDTKKYFSSWNRNESWQPNEVSTPPAFFLNAGVDLTDAGTTSNRNESLSCSFRAGGSNGIPVSNCATFDYAALDGMSTSMGGSFMLFGGLTGINYASGLDSQNRIVGTSMSCGRINSSRSNGCSDVLFSLGVDVLPASAAQNPPSEQAPGLTEANEAISIFNRVSASNGTAPSATAGAVLGFNPEARQLLLFGGTRDLATGTDDSGDTAESYVFDISTQGWTKIPAVVATDAEMRLHPAKQLSTSCYMDPTSSGSHNAADPVGGTNSSDSGCRNSPTGQISRYSGARSHFGYVSIPYAATSSFLSSGLANSSNIDLTDRLLIFGGVGGFSSTATPNSFFRDTFRFNPTFGPEYIDFQSPGTITDGTTYVTRWLESYPSQPATIPENVWSCTTGSASRSGREILCSDGTAPTHSYNGMLTVRHTVTGNNNRAEEDQFAFGYAPMISTLASDPKARAFSIGGGFGSQVCRDATTTGNSVTCTSTPSASKPLVLERFNYLGQAVPSRPVELNFQTTFSYKNDLPESSSSRRAMRYGEPAGPGYWNQVAGPTGVLDYAGMTVLRVSPGFSIAAQATTTDAFISFGGTNCRDYRKSTSTNACPGSVTGASTVGVQFNTSPRYFGLNSTATLTTEAAITTPTGSNYNPSAAGMAAAMGFDGSGTVPIAVAYGGVAGASGSSTSSYSDLGRTLNNDLFFLYDSAKELSSAKWYTVSGSTTTGNWPPPVADAQLVYSHVTHRYYLFGGYTAPTGASRELSQEIWELTVTCTSGSFSTNCISWRRLNDQGMTCSPECPSARFGHRMVEVNYNNSNPTSLITYSSTYCTSTAPCSHAIFMEGGTGINETALADRWIFDPTANGSRGLWLKVNEMPPRNLAAMSTTTYKTYLGSVLRKKAILFGGQTGLASPDEARVFSGNTIKQTFLPPVLGDTLVFDFDQRQWSRVKLLGVGINSTATTDTRSQFEIRQSFLADGGTDYNKFFDELSPPPLAGAVMVTRTHKAPSSGTDSPSLLKIPEVYLFGGRKKDGSYLSLDTAWKFCMGSTGEQMTTPNTNNLPTAGDATCDSYDATDNTLSPSPVDGNVGRWLKKPEIHYRTNSTSTYNSASGYAAYQGAGAYDSYRDRILLYGGLMPTTSGQKVTQVDTRTTLSSSGEIWEYTPASASVTVTTSNGNLDPTASTGRTYRGEYRQIPICSGSITPTPRYGHSMAYDALHDQVLVYGGFNVNGIPLEQDWVENSTTTNHRIPEIWAAKRNGNDTSNPCYSWRQIRTFGNKSDYSSSSSTMPLHSGGNMAAVFIPSSGFNTGYYSFIDTACGDSGPIASPDSNINKLMAGGAYLDIDRGNLGANESLLLHVTYLPFGVNQRLPDGSAISASEQAIFRVHLIKTELSLEEILKVPQPRHLFFSDENRFQKVVHTLDILAPPNGQVRQDQILLPIQMDPGIDRIRIERYQGSGILIDATLHRMGERTQ